MREREKERDSGPLIETQLMCDIRGNEYSTHVFKNPSSATFKNFAVIDILTTSSYLKI
jgi:hypothetical protein